MENNNNMTLFKGCENIYDFIKKLQKLKTEISCSFCENVPSNPVKLKCNHIFCLKCLNINNTCFVCDEKYNSTETFVEHNNICKFVQSSIKKIESVINCKVSEIKTMDDLKTLISSENNNTLSSPSQNTRARTSCQHKNLKSVTSTSTTNLYKVTKNTKSKEKKLTSKKCTANLTNLPKNKEFSITCSKGAIDIINRIESNLNNTDNEDSPSKQTRSKMLRNSLNITVKKTKRVAPMRQTKSCIEINCDTKLLIEDPNSVEEEVSLRDGKNLTNDRNLRNKPTEISSKRGWSGMKDIKKTIKKGTKRKLSVKNVNVPNKKLKKENHLINIKQIPIVKIEAMHNLSAIKGALHNSKLVEAENSYKNLSKSIETENLSKNNSELVETDHSNENFSEKHIEHDTWEDLILKYLQIHNKILEFENAFQKPINNAEELKQSQHSYDCYFRILPHFKKRFSDIQQISALITNCKNETCHMNDTDKINFNILYCDNTVQTDTYSSEHGFRISATEEFNTPDKVNVAIQTEEHNYHNEVDNKTKCYSSLQKTIDLQPNVDNGVIVIDETKKAFQEEEMNDIIDLTDTDPEAELEVILKTETSQKCYDADSVVEIKIDDDDESELVFSIENEELPTSPKNDKIPKDDQLKCKSNTFSQMNNVSVDFQSENSDHLKKFYELDKVLIDEDEKHLYEDVLLLHDEDIVENSEDIVENSEDIVENSEDIVENSEDIVVNCEDVKNFDDIGRNADDQHSEHVRNSEVCNSEGVGNSKDIGENVEDIVGNSNHIGGNVEDQYFEDIAGNSKDIEDQYFADIVGKSETFVENSEDIVRNSENIVINSKDVLLSKNLKNLIVDERDVTGKISTKKNKITVLQDISITGRDCFLQNFINNERIANKDEMLLDSDWKDIIDDFASSDEDIILGTPDSSFNSLTGSNIDLMLFEPLPPPPEFADESTSFDDTNQQHKEVDNTLNHNKDEDMDGNLTSSSSDRSFVLTNYTHNKNKIQNNTSSIPKLNECPTNFGKSPVLLPSNKYNVLSIKSNSQANNFKTIKPIVSSTRLNKAQIKMLQDLQAKNLIVFTNTYNKNVTHMIVNTSENNNLKDVTTKYILSVAAGIWILNCQWVQICYDNNAIVDEEPYEVLDVSGIPGPKNSRITKHITPPLFNIFQIFVATPLISIKKTEIEDVVLMLGGEIVSCLEEFKIKKGNKIQLIIAEATATNQLDLYDMWFKQYDVLTVDIEWLSRSVGQFKIVSLKDYLLSDAEDEILSYPFELLEGDGVQI